MSWRIVIVGAVALVCACGAKTEAESTGSGSGSGGGESTSAEGDASAGEEVGGGGELEHGIVKIRLTPSEAVASDPFVGTTTVKITMYYDECLTAYYSGNPDATIDGVEGETVFGGADLGGEGWQDRLCTVDVGGLLDCSVTSFEQEIGDMVNFLTVTLAVTGEISGRIAPFGPLPTAETAACAGGQLPVVRLSAQGNVTGRDVNDTILWQAESFSPQEAVTDQGAEITVRVAPP